MAIFHHATNSPSKSDLVNAWLFQQPWCVDDSGEAQLVASFHLDDPEGAVGMQVFVVSVGDHAYQVPLTYRDAPLEGNDAASIGTMNHSVLGVRHVHDGLSDPTFLSVLAGVSTAGYGQALGFARYNDRWHSVPDEIVLRGHSTTRTPLPVDGFEPSGGDDAGVVVFINDVIEMSFYRRLEYGRPVPDMGLTATWDGQITPITLVTARLRGTVH